MRTPARKRCRFCLPAAYREYKRHFSAGPSGTQPLKSRGERVAQYSFSDSRGEMWLPYWVSSSVNLAASEEPFSVLGVSPLPSKPAVPRPSPPGTPEASASPILSNMSRLRWALLCLAACRFGGGLLQRAGAAALAASEGRWDDPRAFSGVVLPRWQRKIPFEEFPIRRRLSDAIPRRPHFATSRGTQPRCILGHHLVAPGAGRTLSAYRCARRISTRWRRRR